MSHCTRDVAATDLVKTIQNAKGSPGTHVKVEKRSGRQATITLGLEKSRPLLHMFYLGTVDSQGRLYIQYRGGAPGCLEVQGEWTLGFADFK